MKKWLFAAAVCLSAVVFTAGCGKKKSEAPALGAQETPAAVDAQKAREITYKKLYEANRGSVLLEKYGSVQYEMYISEGYYDDDGNEVGGSETWTLFRQDGEIVLMKEMEDGKENMVCADGTCYYEYVSGGSKKLYSMGWFMDGGYEKYMETGTEDFLLGAESLENFEEIREEGDTYVLLAYVGEHSGEKYYYRYTIDKESFEIKAFEAEVRTEDDAWVLSRATVSHGVNAELPAYVDEMRRAEKKRTVTIHTEEKKDIEVKLPGNVTLLPRLENDFNLFKDKKGEILFNDMVTKVNEDGSYQDAECWLIFTRGR